jgi:hypothetical protein
MTNYIQGREGYHGAGQQTVLTTGVAATEFARCYFNGMPKKVRPELAVLDVAQKIDGHTGYIKGRSHIEGSISGPLYPDELYHSMAWAALIGGSNAVSGTAGVGYTHTLSESSAQASKALLGMTLENFIGGADNTLLKDHIGCFLNKLTISGSAGAAIEYSAEWLGRSETLGGTLSSPTFSAHNPFEFSMLKIEYGASLAASLTEVDTPTKFSWYRNNNITLHYGGSATLVAVSYGTPEIMLEFDFTLKNNADIYNLWNNDTEYAWKVTLTHTELAGTSSGYNSLIINLPRMRMEGDPPDLNGNADITMSVKLRALVEQTAYNYASQVVVVNSTAGTYTV